MTQLSATPGGFFTRFQEFFHTQSVSGGVLISAAILALAWANSPWSDSYFSLWQTQLTVGTPGLGLSLSLHHWINDGLMTLFFFVVGLEIKRELLVGELTQLRKALLPICAAIGGMIVPAVIYVLFNLRSGTLHGWGIPVATDIAFALAVLSILGSRIPDGLKVFLVALAIADDLGAVVVIALFYTSEINLLALLLAAGGLGIAALLNVLGLTRPLPYALLGILVWLSVLLSGVHAAVAGVLLAFCIPARSRIDVQAFYRRCRELLANLKPTISEPQHLRLDNDQQELVGEVERICEQVKPPLDRLERMLHPWIAYGVMPLFALSNAGVSLTSELPVSSQVAVGVLLGLLLGKPLGVSAFAWLAVRLKVAALPQSVTWRQMIGASMICGIGFTMSLFITDLSFSRHSGNDASLDSAKLGILLASVLAGIGGYAWLRITPKRTSLDVVS